jgi:hopene-associated glycosyltransferase HpnB
VVDAIAAASLGAWLYLTFARGFFWRLRFPLSSAPPLPEEARSCRIAAVIPARDEEACIGAAIESLTAQDWPGDLHVYVVDDNSSDDTAGAARRAGGESVTVIQAGNIEPGWTGKLWAMSRGVEHALLAHPDYILFTDADIVHAPDSVRTLVARAEAERLDLASIMVKLRCDSAAERLLVPAFVFFFFMLYPPAWIARRGRRTAGAAGGCILIRPEALERIGGLRAIRGELIDDCALASAVKLTGGSLWLGMSGTTRSIREYPRFSDIRRMVSRTAFTQLRYSTAMLAVTCAGIGFLYVVPVLAALTGSAYGVLAWVLLSAIFVPMVRFYGQPAALAATLPLVALFYLTATIESAVRCWLGRGGAWKGRNQAASAT